ncbi:Hypothetical_protein [Hexamita inflata]|uniref:Hypothetical_protein n=1 Tax=Hexamita inflata TaxID=28002 RepID=A0AA86TKJ4_9EUKA|nr:Hypothetical protein HINF_LOCUS9029 [Hexamita inflata]
MLDKQGRGGNALSIQTFHKASLCFSLCHQAAIGENANLKRRPMCVRGFSELLKRNVAFRRVRIPFARRDAFARLRLKDVMWTCATVYLSALNAKTGLARWRCSNDRCDGVLFRTRTRDKLHGFQPSPQNQSRNFELRRKRLPSRWRIETCATCFVEPAFQFSSGMQCQSRIPFGNHHSKDLFFVKLFLKLQVNSRRRKAETGPTIKQRCAISMSLK